MATTIPLKELRNNVSDVLRRAEAGEDFTVTVAGRAVARLQAESDSPWVPVGRLDALWESADDPALAADIRALGRGDNLRDPWEKRQ